MSKPLTLQFTRDVVRAACSFSREMHSTTWQTFFFDGRRLLLCPLRAESNRHAQASQLKGGELLAAQPVQDIGKRIVNAILSPTDLEAHHGDSQRKSAFPVRDCRW